MRLLRLNKTCPLILAGLLGLLPDGSQPASPPATPVQPAVTVFISDLHFGVGKDPKTDKWHSKEDFRWSKEFALFLDEIHRMGNGKTVLVVNGDAFELWQSLVDDCNYETIDKNLGCTKEEAVRRIKHVTASHTTELQAIGDFASKGNNEVVIVPGNHDGALMFEDVAKEVLAAIPSASGRVSIKSEGYWLSPDGLIYAEHGHQIGEEVNRFDSWPTPFLAGQGDAKHLQRPWGEQFVQKYFNQWETTYPIIDNMSSEWDGLNAGLAAENLWGVTKGLGKLVKFYLFQQSWKQFTQNLGPQAKGSLPSCKDNKPPCWDYKKIRDEQGDRFFVDSVPKGNPYRAILEEALREKAVGLTVQDLTNEEIKELCDKRTLLRMAGENIDECPMNGTLGAIKENVFRSRDAVFKEHLEKTDRALQQRGKPKQSFEVFVYSHTHRAEAAFSPMEEKASWRPRMINTGAWQRVVDPDQLKAIQAARGITDDKVLLTLKPEDLPPCYSAVIIKPYKDWTNLRPTLRYWRQNIEGKWGFKASCDWIP